MTASGLLKQKQRFIYIYSTYKVHLRLLEEIHHCCTCGFWPTNSMSRNSAVACLHRLCGHSKRYVLSPHMDASSEQQLLWKIQTEMAATISQENNTNLPNTIEWTLFRYNRFVDLISPPCRAMTGDFLAFRKPRSTSQSSVFAPTPWVAGFVKGKFLRVSSRQACRDFRILVPLLRGNWLGKHQEGVARILSDFSVGP